MQYTRWSLGSRFGFDMKAIIDKIEAVTRQAGFIYTFALILLRDLSFHLMTPPILIGTSTSIFRS
jgi:hypothetical protein